VIALARVCDAVAPGILGLVKGAIGGAQEARDVGQFAGIRSGGDAEAGGDSSVGPILRFDGRPKRFGDSLSDEGIHAGKQHDELFTAVASHQIAGACVGPERGGDHSENFVAGQMAEFVVV
jgi:hypothetical protein